MKIKVRGKLPAQVNEEKRVKATSGQEGVDVASASRMGAWKKCPSGLHDILATAESCSFCKEGGSVHDVKPKSLHQF